MTITPGQIGIVVELPQDTLDVDAECNLDGSILSIPLIAGTLTGEVNNVAGTQTIVVDLSPADPNVILGMYADLGGLYLGVGVETDLLMGLVSLDADVDVNVNSLQANIYVANDVTPWIP